MTAVRGRGGVGDVLEARGEPGWAELGEARRALLDGADPGVRVIGVQQLKAKVYRLQLDAGAPWSSLVVKRLEPAVAHRTQLVAQRWLTALGLGDRCARLLGVAGDRAAPRFRYLYIGHREIVLEAALLPGCGSDGPGFVGAHSHA